MARSPGFHIVAVRLDGLDFAIAREYDPDGRIAGTEGWFDVEAFGRFFKAARLIINSGLIARETQPGFNFGSSQSVAVIEGDGRAVDIDRIAKGSALQLRVNQTGIMVIVQAGDYQ